VPEGDQDHGRVADPMPVVPRGLDQLFNLELGSNLAICSTGSSPGRPNITL
jgi:hypothetical protein